MVDWAEFRFFLAIAREGTLSGAARRLKVDQSTVGRRLAELEGTSKARLFDRTPDGYVLTAAGEAVLPLVEEIEAAAISVERRLVGEDASLEGTVRVATSDSLAAWFLVPRLPALRARHPGVLLELVTGNLPVNLARREADLSLRLSKPEQPNLIARCLGQAAWALYASKSYLRALRGARPRAKLEGHDVIAFGRELERTIGARWLAENGERGRVALTSNSLVAHGAAVVAGLGVSPLPCLFGDVQTSLQRVIPGVIGHHDVWLVVHPDVKRSAKVRVVMDELTRLVKDEAPLLAGRSTRS